MLEPETGAKLTKTVLSYLGDVDGEHDRDRSWEICHCYFRKVQANQGLIDRDQSALQLAFYLASWGMYRGSSFLHKYAYTIHREVIDVIGDTAYGALWDPDFGGREGDLLLAGRILELRDRIRQPYQRFAQLVSLPNQPTDLLISKVILGTFGCLPACDEYFVKGFNREILQGHRFSSLNQKFVESVIRYCHAHFDELVQVRAMVEKRRGVHYPLMKLLDMYFWQAGSD